MREFCIRDGAGTRSNTGKDHKSSLPVAEASEMSGYTPAGMLTNPSGSDLARATRVFDRGGMECHNFFLRNLKN